MNDVIFDLPIDSVIPDPNQPRKIFDAEGLASLASSILTHGILEPVIVRSLGSIAVPPVEYMLIAGERRFRASKQAGLTTIRAMVRDDFSPTQVEEVAVTENVGRKDLNPMEEGRAFNRMRLRGLDDTEIGKRSGCLPVHVSKRIDLLRLAVNLQEMVEKGQLGPTTGQIISELEGEDQQLATRALVNNDLTVDALRQFCGAIHERKMTPPLFEEVLERSLAVRDFYAQWNRAYELAIAAINGLIDPKTLSVAANALGSGEIDLVVQKVRLIITAVHKLEDGLLGALAVKAELDG